MAFLLEHGANINAEPYNGTALHWAVRQDQTEAAAWLLDHGADINRRAGFGGVRGITPLHAAVAWDGKGRLCGRHWRGEGSAWACDPEYEGGQHRNHHAR
jgi:hypothetical protein